MNFGTGEGHLAVYPESNEYSYSGSAFEGAFSGMGVSQQHAHSLVSDLRRGGAIASVNANDRLNDAERVLTLNNGRIRYEASTNALPSENIPDGRVHIYGELSKPYTSYLSQADPARRKAS
ncbi:MAG TPA: hypothetical protein VHB45_06385 [Alloacidobacterium sp.]|nr:hypothetical protein [Alloacidobacterium sp.]